MELENASHTSPNSHLSGMEFLMNVRDHIEFFCPSYIKVGNRLAISKNSFGFMYGFEILDLIV